ncbi:MAG: diacylglycerol kinase family protein [Propionicimonas sp.]|nr:diacylglycerol kinase family protein [Propionicimonas sp.]
MSDSSGSGEQPPAVPPSARPEERWAVVVNPVKLDDPAVTRHELTRVCADNGWPEPLWYETTASDPGTGQARDAVAAGARLVCPLGGDGTVRAVAAGLLDSGAVLGLLPSGTGNLLARNLGLPTGDLTRALTVALTGRDAAIDVGSVRFDNGQPEIFLVMAGMGLDAETMAQTSTSLKRRIGWFAYVLGGLKALFRAGFAVAVTAGDQRTARQRAATVLVGNCGELTGGLQLMPDARVDDGRLDAVVVSPRSLASWLALMVHILSRHRRGHRTVSYVTGSAIEVDAVKPVQAELDGDPVGEVRSLLCRVLPGALTVRVPA